MAIEDSVPPGFLSRRGGALACPSCGQAEEVHAVPAIYESARAAEETVSRARRTINDDDASLARKRAARQQLAAAAPLTIRSSLLAPAPKAHVARCLVGALFSAIPAGFLWAMYRSSEEFSNSTGLDAASSGDSTLRMLAILCMAISGFCLAMTFLALVRRRGINKGRPAAEAVWCRGWYCARCAVVHFRADEQPAGVGSDQPLAPEEFRNIVWRVGGYGRTR